MLLNGIVSICLIRLNTILKCDVTKFRIPPPPLSHSITLRRPPPPLNVWRNLWIPFGFKADLGQFWMEMELAKWSKWITNKKEIMVTLRRSGTADASRGLRSHILTHLFAISAMLTSVTVKCLFICPLCRAAPMPFTTTDHRFPKNPHKTQTYSDVLSKPFKSSLH